MHRPRPTGTRLRYRGGRHQTFRLFDDGSHRVEGGRHQTGKARRRQVRRLKAGSS
jgi:hypothetical protein